MRYSNNWVFLMVWSDFILTGKIPGNLLSSSFIRSVDAFRVSGCETIALLGTNSQVTHRGIISVESTDGRVEGA